MLCLKSQSTEEDPSSLLDKLLNAIHKTLNLLKKPAIVAILLDFLILGHPFSRALAASGGSIGGDSWSSSDDSSSSYSSWSSSDNSSSSYSSWSSSSDDDYDTTPSYSSSSSDSSRRNSKISSNDYETISSESNSETTPSYSSSSSSPVIPTRPVARSSSKAMSDMFLIILIMGCLAFLIFSGIAACSSTKGRVVTQPKKTTVVKLQVCLLGSARSFQRDLDQLAEKADTSTKAGLSYATILVAVDGVHEINSSSDLKIALQKLGSISSSKLKAVRVLWTPQQEGDTLSESKVLEDYPLLKPL
ncbi:hypothetical protein LUZ61_001476 [Rhynchospora tenuis]|uniref:Uncharacterized protein n=1 Tax=Rhynchospora tenuis TaxID=198213 RepID=A0AAD5ZH16_9POAL|nr:hypothetical protein LUZ61_001476 [Rhynchospora tenuis]